MFRRRSARPSDSGARPILRLRRGELSRGQGLVEFALVLPILMLLTLIALDFGRIYLGYINVQQMARIGANFAANNPTAWDATPVAAMQLKYSNQIFADAAAINCALPVSLPAPTFTDMNGNGAGDLGDTVQVRISCTFGVITPIISAIVGSTVQVSAESNFPVKSGMTASGSGGGGPGSPPNAAFSGNGEITPTPVSGVAPFLVDFRDTSGGAPNEWFWDFHDGTPTTTAQDPLGHTFDCAFASCTYLVEMVATNTLGSDSATMSVTVVTASTVNFTADQQSITPGTTVTFTDASTVGTTYDWTFGAGEGTGTGTTTTHRYDTVGTYEVSLTVTYPSPIGPLTETKPGFITVGVGQCVVPSLNGIRFNNADAIWKGSPYNFTGAVIDAPGLPNGNYFINSQSQTAGGSPPATAPCDSDVIVSGP